MSPVGQIGPIGPIKKVSCKTRPAKNFIQCKWGYISSGSLTVASQRVLPTVGHAHEDSSWDLSSLKTSLNSGSAI